MSAGVFEYRMNETATRQQRVSTPRFILNDGRQFFTGGNVSDNFDPVDFTFFLTFQPVNVKQDKTVPSDFSLRQNYPNPFNPTTTISFSVREKSDITISVYSVLGELVTTLFQGSVNAGDHSVKFNAGNLASGMYICQIRNAANIISKKMLLLK
jgi:hypothetical protein